MQPRDILLAILTSSIWGVAFVATKFGIDSFTGAQLTVLRFAIAGSAVLLLPRPPVPLPRLIAIGATLFLGQFLLLFLAFQAGMPPGVASVTQQLQVFFTVVLAAVLLGEIPTSRQASGIAIAFVGLGAIGLSAGADLPMLALSLALAGALSWAAGNILVKGVAGVPMLSLVAWASLVPPLPALAFSYLFDPAPSLLHALADASWRGIGAALYLGVVATLGAYAMWGYLLGRYKAAAIAPFALLSPCVGVIASVLTFGEAFPPLRLIGMLFILTGLAIILLPARAASPPQAPPA